MHLFFDKSSVELFADDGQVIMTEIFFPNEDFNELSLYVENGKVDWSKGNKTTGMGEYTISNKQLKDSHYKTSSFNLANSKGIEVPTTFHGTPTSRIHTFDNEKVTNRMSNGCINGKCADLTKLYKEYNLDIGDKVYILPEEDGNSVTIDSDGIKFNASYQNKINANKENGINVTTDRYMTREQIRNYQTSLKKEGYYIIYSLFLISKYITNNLFINT